MIYLDALFIYLAIGCIFSIFYLAWEFVHAGPEADVPNRVLLADVGWSFIYAIVVVTVLLVLRLDWLMQLISSGE